MVPVSDQAELARREARSHALLAATEAAVWTVSPSGEFVEPQPSWQDYTGQSWEECRGLGWLQAVHEDDRPHLLKAWNARTARGDIYSAQYRLLHAASGEYRTVVARAAPIRDANGVIIEWTGTLTDIHNKPLTLPELYRVNDTLTQQLEHQTFELHRFFELSLDVMLSLDANGRLLTVSPSFRQVTGVQPSEAVGRHFSDFVPEEEIERIKHEIAAVLQGRNAIDFETRLKHVDGTRPTVSWRAVAVAGESRLYAVGRDVTDQKLAEQRLIRAERLEAVGRLTGGIAHDFNNVLAAMMGYLEIGSRIAQDTKIVRLFESALDAGRRGSKLVGQLLSFARKQELSLQPVNLNRLIQDLQPLVAQATRGNVSLHLDLDPMLFEVEADPTQVEMAILNLCINARDAMPAGGTVVLRSWKHSISGEVAGRVDDLPAGEYGCFSVIDSGIGMDEATLARCFEPFFTTKGPGRGTGLGLAQALGAVQHCGGTMHIDSKPGLGTRVDVFLRRAAMQGAPAAKPTTSPSLARPAVLVVDDDPDVLRSTAALVDALGYEVTAAASAQTAVGILLTGKPMEVVLTDYKMPGMNGAELLQELSQLRPKVIGVLMTGEMDVATIRQALQGTSVLQKPVRAEQLSAVLAQSVEAHRRQTVEVD